MQRVTRLAWARLNGDGLMLAALAGFSALDLTAPSSSALAKLTGGVVPPAFYVWTVCYAVATVCLLMAFWGSKGHRMPFELLGRLLLVVGYGIETWRTGLLLDDWGGRIMVTKVVVFVILVIVCSLRASLLLDKKGVVVIIGRRPQ